MKLLNNRVLVEEIKEEKGEGIQVASGAKSNYTLIKGKVLVSTAGLEEMRLIAQDDVVYFAWGDKVNIDGKDLYLVDYSNIACIL